MKHQINELRPKAQRRLDTLRAAGVIHIGFDLKDEFAETVLCHFSASPIESFHDFLRQAIRDGLPETPISVEAMALGLSAAARECTAVISDSIDMKE